ncbi:receptor-type tyrosine-protein phosphatase alpha-like [Liolophura sinensis]|uniref:receptor-type tyrosine-protein phosphatase alpha-like n=1 Tax=Liolophura sinensis TaxID=3198878 RepID=UPI0031595E8B
MAEKSGGCSRLTLFLVVFVCILTYSQADECVDGYFGWKCKFQCQCANNDVCDKVTGECPNGCATDKYGTNCLLSSNCIYDQFGRNYTGFHSSAGGRVCLRWDSNFVKQRGFRPEQFPDGKFPKNYCRNPGRHTSHVPWCFTSESAEVPWTYCTIKRCDCDDYRFGDSCLSECHCHNPDEACHKSLGICQSGCAPGWTGIDCQQACKAGYHGVDCRNKCGLCHMGACDRETGLCPFGCGPGKTGKYCNETCPRGLFGRNCVGLCGHCRFKERCDSRTGRCPFGCEAGWSGNSCKDGCTPGRWGIDCENLCFYCAGRVCCDARDGTCPGGCIPGWYGKHCHKECQPGYYGVNCSRTCGYCLNKRPCDAITGKCLEGCAQGYDGDLCIIGLSRGSAEAAAAGGVIAAIMVFLVVLLVVFLIMKRRKRHRNQMYNLQDMHEVHSDHSKETDNLINMNREKEHTVMVEEPGEPSGDDMEGRTGEPIYANVNTKKQSSPVCVEDLYNYIQKHKENNWEGFKKEYEQLPVGLLAICDHAKKAENKPKNRYGNIIAYDHSRVVLEPYPEDVSSDYVNANYMDGYKCPKAYIASQGPNKPMLKDFWRMIWQKEIGKIVMLTNLVEACRKKCEQYWPEEGTAKYGDLELELTQSVKYTDFTVRTFQLKREEEERVIKQFHFNTWSDHGAPTYPTALLAFLRKVNKYQTNLTGPILVHCRTIRHQLLHLEAFAGIGRSGTYMALDYLLQQAHHEGIVDVLAIAQLMRTNRVNMIQALEQYVFVYDALLEAIKAGETTFACSDFHEVYQTLCTLPPNSKTTPLDEQYEVLQLLSPTMEKDECTAAMAPENIDKNRFKNILPANRCRPYLYTPVDGCNDYINAIFLPGYTHREAFLVTQMPLPSTVADFWRLLYDYQSDTVVMLNEFSRDDSSCALYWPEEHGYTVEYGPLSVELLSSSESDPYVTKRVFRLVHSTKGEERAVRQFQFNAWPKGQSVPSSTSALLHLLDMVEEGQPKNNKSPITVHCMNGACQSGLFCAASLICERIKVDDEVNVFQTVKQIRINRPQFINDEEQYQFCYQMALEYLDSRQ